jgi:hypothetical protein
MTLQTPCQTPKIKGSTYLPRDFSRETWQMAYSKKCSVTAEYIENLGRTNNTPAVATVRTVNEGPTTARGIVVGDEG